MSAPEYAIYNGEPVQVLDRFTAKADCRVCGGDGYLEVEGGECPYCEDGKEPEAKEWAKIGLLSGDDRGTRRVVLAAAVHPETDNDRHKRILASASRVSILDTTTGTIQ